MQHSYFHKPDGIHRTQSGFSMGGVSASKGSVDSLRGSELETFEKLDQNNVLVSVDLNNQFRDYIFSHINGDYASIRKAVELISTCYPQDIVLNFKTNIIQVYNTPEESTRFTTILRKKNTHYDIIPPTSKTHQQC